MGKYVQYMKGHALIEKFLGIFPTNRALIGWINSLWNPKGHINLKFGSKGLFTTIFHNQEDKEIFFKNKPYFFNLVGLHLRY